MPIIFSRGSLSARGAGAFAYIPPPPAPPPPGPPPPGPPPPGPVLQTVTLYSSGSWTAPAGVTQIINLSVVGGRYGQTEGFWDATNTRTIAFYSYRGSYTAGSPTAFYTYSQAGSLADSIVAYINSGGTGERDISYSYVAAYYDPRTGNYENFDQPVSLRVRGTASQGSGPWDNRSNDPIMGIGNGWYYNIEVYTPPQIIDGTPSSAFGYTSAGGTNTVPPPPIYVAGPIGVVPGQTYNITVGKNNGAVQFQFYQ